MNLYEKRLSNKFFYKGKAVSFRVDTVRLPNNKKAVREYLDHPGAVAVLPLLTQDRIVMVQQFRHPVGKVTLEIPAGKIDKGEAILTCLKRELEEETGYKAATFKKIISFWPTPAFANEIIHIYLAKGLKPGPSNPDSDEFLKIKILSLSKLQKLILRGQLKDSKTIIALLAYLQIRRKISKRPIHKGKKR